METLSEGQKQNNYFNKKGEITKQGDKKLTTQIIEVTEQEKKKKLQMKELLK